MARQAFRSGQVEHPAPPRRQQRPQPTGRLEGGDRAAELVHEQVHRAARAPRGGQLLVERPRPGRRPAEIQRGPHDGMPWIAPHQRLGLHLRLGVDAQGVHRVVFAVAARRAVAPAIEDQVGGEEDQRDGLGQPGEVPGDLHVLEARPGRVGLAGRAAAACRAMEDAGRPLGREQPVDGVEVGQVDFGAGQPPGAQARVTHAPWPGRGSPAGGHLEAGVADEPAGSGHPDEA